MSTIGAGGLNCCVRDGNRCPPAAVITKTIPSFKPHPNPLLRKEREREGVIKNGKTSNITNLSGCALGRLVLFG